MLINVWSSPRTGSNWLSFFLKNKYEQTGRDVVFLSEPFNPYHHRLYYEEKGDGEILNHQEFRPGTYWNKYSLNESGTIQIQKVFSPKPNSWEIECQHRLEVVSSAKHDAVLINHNHLSPLDASVFLNLKDRARQNYYTYRKDKKMQLASYAIAYYTKRFISFKNSLDSTVYDGIVDPKVLEDLCGRILSSEEKSVQIPGCIRVAYEDLNFVTFDNGPRKQVENSWNQLGPGDKLVITDLLKKYGLE